MPEPLPHPTRASARRWLVALAVVGLVVATACTHRAGAVPGYTTEPTIVRVVDGDTVIVRIGRVDERVRLIGIDTPETKHPSKPVQCFGKEASAFTEATLPPGTVVRLERDVTERDDYGRLLAYVWRAADGLFVNLELAAQGYADVLTIPPNVAHAAQFVDAVRAARDQDRGLWQRCGGPGVPAG